MKKAIYFIGLAFALLLSVSSCQKAPFLTFNGQKSFTFKDTGGSETITFSCNRAWTAKSSESWITVSPAQGDANEEGARVTITCAANTTYDSRTATVTISSEGLTETISISQDSNFGVIVSPTSVVLTKAEQSFEIEVQANIKYSVSVDKDCEWLSAVGGNTKALTSNKYGFKVAANNTYSNRNGKIYVLGENSNLLQTIEVTQSQTDGLIVEQASYEIENNGGDIEVKLQTNVKVDAIIPEPAKEWLSVKSNSTKAMSDESIVFTIAKNETYFGRSAEIVLKGNELQETITISQAQTDAMFVTNEKEYSFTKTGGEAKVNIFYNVDHIVDGASIPSWITYNSEDVDDNNKTYNFTIAPNTEYVAKNAEIVFKSKDATLKDIVKVNQEQVNTVHTNQTKFTLSKKGDEFSVVVYSNVDYTIEKPEWLKEKSASIIESKPLETTYIYTVEAVDEGRSGSITYKWKDGDVDKTTVVDIEQKNLTVSVTLTEAGTLLEKIGTIELLREIDEIIISGPINGTDVNAIKSMSKLSILNMENAIIKAGGEVISEYYRTKDNAISEYMFKNTTIRQIILPRSIISIDNNAFIFGKMENIQIYPGVTIIDDDALRYCDNLKEIDIPEGVVKLGERSLYANSQLARVTLPETLEIIETLAFHCDYALKQITFPANVHTIKNAFWYCTGLTDVYIHMLPSTIQDCSSAIFSEETYQNAILHIRKGMSISDYWQTDFFKFVHVIDDIE